MLTFVLYLIICLCICYASISTFALYKKTDESIIRQIDYIDESTFDLLLHKQNPVCIHKANIQLPELFLKLKHPNIVDYVNRLHSPLSFTHSVFVTNDYPEYRDKILCTEKDRTFIIQSQGESTIKLYAPSQKHLLYLSKYNDLKVSPSLNHEENKQKYPLLNKSKYVRIPLREGQILFIPFNWSFSVLNQESSTSFVSMSHTLASTFLSMI